MRKRFIIAVLAALLLCAGCAPKQALTFTATVYPIYGMLLNLTRGVDGVKVACLAPNTAGCAHDYQMTSNDRRLLADSDLVAINGSGLEPYLEPVLSTIKAKTVDTSEGIELIMSRGEHGGIELNPHVWVSIPRAVAQMRTLASALKRADPSHAGQYDANLAETERKLMAMFEKMTAALAPYQGSRIATFHPAFDYFADDFGLVVAASLTDDPDTPPSAKELAEFVDIIKAHPVKGLFVEPGGVPESAAVAARESGTPVYELNPATFPMEGIADADAYLASMEYNLNILINTLK